MLSLQQCRLSSLQVVPGQKKVWGTGEAQQAMYYEEMSDPSGDHLPSESDGHGPEGRGPGQEELHTLRGAGQGHALPAV